MIPGGRLAMANAAGSDAVAAWLLAAADVGGPEHLL
jgi:hypothetical protein